MDELLDMVNENDKIIGAHERSWFYKNNNHYYYDFSIGGHVQSNETYQDAACREIEEEIGLSIKEDRLIQIAYLKYPNHLQTSVIESLY